MQAIKAIATQECFIKGCQFGRCTGAGCAVEDSNGNFEVVSPPSFEDSTCRSHWLFTWKASIVLFVCGRTYDVCLQYFHLLVPSLLFAKNIIRIVWRCKHSINSTFHHARCAAAIKNPRILVLYSSHFTVMKCMKSAAEPINNMPKTVGYKEQYAYARKKQDSIIQDFVRQKVPKY